MIYERATRRKGNIGRGFDDEFITSESGLIGSVARFDSKRVKIKKRIIKETKGRGSI